MIEKPRSDGTRRSSSFGGDLWNARRESQLESGPREAGESNPSRPHEPTGRWQWPMENSLLSTSRQRHAERWLMVLSSSTSTLTAMECHGSVDKSEEPELQNVS